MIRGYLIALDPTSAQTEQFKSHCGASRYVYNWGLALIKANISQRAAERTYDISDDQLTPSLSWHSYEWIKQWNAVKRDIAPWYTDNSSRVYIAGIQNLSVALTNWSASKSGSRVGRKVEFPRFKTKNSYQSCRFIDGNGIKLSPDRRHVRLPSIGWIRTHESTRKLARKIEAGIARIRSATLSYQRGRWHLSFSVDLPDPVPFVRITNRVVGVDLGIKSLAVLSTGEFISNSRFLDKSLNSLRKAQRRCSRRRGFDKRTRTLPSNRYIKAKSRVLKIHTRIANQRRDGLYKLTTKLVQNFDTIVLENLNVSGMMRNRKLSRSIFQLGWAELRRQIEYKAQEVGVKLVIADRWFPSSKTCSNCQTVKTKLSLAERTFKCDVCYFTLDRDLNAALNLASLVSQVPSEPSCGRTLSKLDGNLVRPDSRQGYCHEKTQSDSSESTSHREVLAS